jgi:hypothetical protein
MWRLYKTGFELPTGFIGLHSVTHLQPSLLQLQLTLTTESQLLLSLFQGPGPPADPTGSHWPSTNSSALRLQLLGWNTDWRSAQILTLLYSEDSFSATH